MMEDVRKVELGDYVSINVKINNMMTMASASHAPVFII